MPYATVEWIRDQFPIDISSPEKHKDELLETLAAKFEVIFEDALGFSPVEKVVVGEEHRVSWPARRIRLDFAGVKSIEAVRSDGVVLAGEFKGTRSGFVRGHRLLAGDVEVDYTHGLEEYFEQARLACALYVRREASAIANPNTGNSYATVHPETGIVDRHSTADRNAGRFTGWIDVDRMLQQFPDHRPVIR
jgi:hypothetical protein